MKPFLKHKAVNYIFFVLLVFLLECVSIAFMHLGFFPTYFYLDLLVFMILGSPIFFFKKTLFDKIYLPIITAVLVTIFLINTNYYLDTGVIYSLQFLSLAKEGDAKEIFKHIYWYTIITELIILIICYTFFYIFNTKFKYSTNFKRRDVNLIVGISLAVISGFYPLSIFFTSKIESSINNNSTIDYPTYGANYNMKTLGIITYYIKEMKYIYGKSLNSNEQLKTYYLNCTKENNEFTGLCKNMNVVSIMIETGDKYMVNEFTTPNLYNFLNDGIDCSSNYTKHFTGISELIGIAGNFFTNKIDTSNLKVPFSLPNMLKNDYTTIYTHDFGHKHDLYSRERNIPNLGFEKHYFHNELYPEKPEWEWRGYYYFDSDTTDRIINLLKKEEINYPLYLHYTTLTMHYPYKKINSNEKYINDLESRYKDKLTELKNAGKWKNVLENTQYQNYANDLDIYTLKCMDFDVALGKFLNYFKEINQFDNTLFVLYGDHDVCGFTNDGKYRLSQLINNNVNDYNNIKLFNTILGFYNPKLNKQFKTKYGNNIYNKFTTIDVIVPTLLDLLGIPYSPKIYYTDSIFSNSYSKNNILYSTTLSKFLNLNYCSDNGSNISKVFNENDTKNDFVKNCKDHLERQIKIDSIYKNNTFKYFSLKEFIPTN